jgi:hypothetical protein
LRENLYIGIMIVRSRESDHGMCTFEISNNFTGDESGMRVKGNVHRIATAVLGMQLLAGLAAVPALAAGKSQTLTGEVSDAMCGAKHEMKGKLRRARASA